MPDITLTAASAILPNTNFPGRTTVAGTNYPVEILQFDATAATAEEAHWQLSLEGYGGGDLAFKIVWYGESANSGQVNWEIAVSAFTPNTDDTSIEAAGFGSPVEADDPHLGTTNEQLMEITVTLSSPAEKNLAADGDFLEVRLRRRSDDVTNDTMSGDANVPFIVLTYA
jgi:hypothetical protein